jgi:hypothetical protein
LLRRGFSFSPLATFAFLRTTAVFAVCDERVTDGFRKNLLAGVGQVHLVLIVIDSVVVAVEAALA